VGSPLSKFSDGFPDPPFFESLRDLTLTEGSGRPHGIRTKGPSTLLYKYAFVRNSLNNSSGCRPLSSGASTAAGGFLLFFFFALHKRPATTAVAIIAAPTRMNSMARSVVVVYGTRLFLFIGNIPARL
jgi:hypothetical protein